MSKFNFAFVANAFLVCLIGLTIGLFVFAGPKSSYFAKKPERSPAVERVVPANGAETGEKAVASEKKGVANENNDETARSVESFDVDAIGEIESAREVPSTATLEETPSVDAARIDEAPSESERDLRAETEAGAFDFDSTLDSAFKSAERFDLAAADRELGDATDADKPTTVVVSKPVFDFDVAPENADVDDANERSLEVGEPTDDAEPLQEAETDEQIAEIVFDPNEPLQNADTDEQVADTDVDANEPLQNADSDAQAADTDVDANDESGEIAAETPEIAYSETDVDDAETREAQPAPEAVFRPVSFGEDVSIDEAAETKAVEPQEEAQEEARTEPAEAPSDEREEETAETAIPLDDARNEGAAPTVAADSADGETSAAEVADEPLLAETPSAVEPQNAEPNETPDVAETPESNEALENADAPESNEVAETPETFETRPTAEPQDEFWIAFADGADFAFLRLDGDRWTRVGSAEFFGTDDPSRATIVWAHGYQTDLESATQDAFVLRSVLEQARVASGKTRAFRLVVWKWASERDDRRLRKDALQKARYADVWGRALGGLVARLNPADDVSLIGFSFGARVVGSALETLATEGRVGALDGALDESTGATKGRTSLILVDAACDESAFWASGAYGRGARLATGVLNEFNVGDRALKFYPFVSDARSTALGRSPVSAQTFPNAAGAVLNVDLRPAVGKRHSFVDAIQATPRDRLAELTL